EEFDELVGMEICERFIGGALVGNARVLGGKQKEVVLLVSGERAESESLGEEVGAGVGVLVKYLLVDLREALRVAGSEEVEHGALDVGLGGVGGEDVGDKVFFFAHSGGAGPPGESGAFGQGSG